MTRLNSFHSQCLLAAGLFLAVSEAHAANIYRHPLCKDSGGTQATSCTELSAFYRYFPSNEYQRIDRVEAVISEDCRVATNEGTATIVAASEGHLVLPDTKDRYTPLEVRFVFPSGCAVKLHGRHQRKKSDVARWFQIDSSLNVGVKASVILDLANGAIIIPPRR